MRFVKSEWSKRALKRGMATLAVPSSNCLVFSVKRERSLFFIRFLIEWFHKEVSIKNYLSNFSQNDLVRVYHLCVEKFIVVFDVHLHEHPFD